MDKKKGLYLSLRHEKRLDIHHSQPCDLFVWSVNCGVIYLNKKRINLEYTRNYLYVHMYKVKYRIILYIYQPKEIFVQSLRKLKRNLSILKK